MLRRITQEQTRLHIHLDSSHQSVYKRAVAFCLSPSRESGWEEVTYYGEAVFDPVTGAVRKPEWIYILVNKNIPGVCKIGYTTTSVEQRTREINSATGVITPWFPVYRYKCVLSRFVEEDVHQYLEEKGYRINPRREGFEIDPTTAREVIEAVGEKYKI